MKYKASLRIFVVLFSVACHAQDSVFTRVNLCSLNESHEQPVTLTLTDRDIQLESKQPVVSVRVLYSSISGISYERSAHHRIPQGAAAGVVSPAAGLIVGATKANEYWLAIDYVEGGNNTRTVLRLDKREYQEIMSDLEKRTGKSVAVVNAAAKDLDPTDGSKDVDETVRFTAEKVAAALTRAMLNVGCEVQKQDPTFIQCKRRPGNSSITGVGGENVIARIDFMGTGTRLRIMTEKVALRDRNWSRPIFQDTYRQLEDAK
jgi:hypothetical protein